MKAFTDQQKLAAIILPMCTGFVSSLASGTIIYSILRSSVKLKVPYRRLIFGLSCFDFIVSVSFALSTLPMPSESGLIPELALGTESTCTAQGFFFIFGFLGSVFYSCSLSIYYFCTLKLNMPFTRFQKNCEVYLHLLSIGWALVACVICLADDSFNATPTHCTVTSFPQECIEDNEIECIKGKRSYIYQWAFVAVPSFAVFLTIVYVMISVGKKFAFLEPCTVVPESYPRIWWCLTVSQDEMTTHHSPNLLNLISWQQFACTVSRKM
jgi:hypothetical protein